MANDTEVISEPTSTEEEGWKKILTHVIDNIHDKLTFGTQKKKEALEDAAGEKYPGGSSKHGFKNLTDYNK